MRALDALAGYSDGYREMHADMLEQFDIDRRRLLEAGPKTGLQVFLYYYALNRAGSTSAGYPSIAVAAVGDVHHRKGLSRSPDEVWAHFRAYCHQEEKKPNRTMNRRALLDSTRLAQDVGNVFRWAREEIQDSGRVEPVHDRVIEIHGIGDKIARFFTRDATWLAGFEGQVPQDETRLLHPVDVWVRRVALALWLDIRREVDAETISQRLADACSEAGVSNVAANQGSWYFATQVNGGSVEGLRQRLESVTNTSIGD